EAGTAVIGSVGKQQSPPLLTCWLGEATARIGREQFSQAGLATYENPAAGVLVTPKARRSARTLVERVLAEGRTLLSEAESKQLLAAYGIPVVETRLAKDTADAVRIAGEIGGVCALKIASPDITHKSDAGGVRLNLRGPADVEAAAASILRAVAGHAPAARIEGFSVE